MERGDVNVNVICNTVVALHRGAIRADGLSIHFIRNVFAITLRRRSHGLSNGPNGVRGPRTAP